MLYIMILLLDKELIMDDKQLGKDQTYSRLLNNRLVISKLQQKNYSVKIENRQDDRIKLFWFQ